MKTELVSLKTFSIRPEAERAQQILEGSGISSLIRGDDAGGWAPHIGFGTGGVALLVERTHFDQAKKLLDDADG
jgi:hypothetical protein